MAEWGWRGEMEDWMEEEVWRQAGEEAAGTEVWMEGEEVERGAGRALLKEAVGWVGMDGLEGSGAAGMESEEKMFPVVVSEKLSGQCPGERRWLPSYFHRFSVGLNLCHPLSSI